MSAVYIYAYETKYLSQRAHVHNILNILTKARETSE